VAWWYQSFWKQGKQIPSSIPLVVILVANFCNCAVVSILLETRQTDTEFDSFNSYFGSKFYNWNVKVKEKKKKLLVQSILGLDTCTNRLYTVSLYWKYPFCSNVYILDLTSGVKVRAISTQFYRTKSFPLINIIQMKWSASQTCLLARKSKL
jgi:hypothetical protein